jgi:DNA-binding SARP family transcriptional activator
MGEGIELLSGLALSLLGHLAITVNDQPFGDIRNRPALALCMYLACQPERHRRESLMALLWPDWPPASAQQNLRQNLYVLRQALSKVASLHGGDLVPLILADRETLQLNPDADVSVDAWRFAELLEQPQPIIAHLTEAVALYRGDFLADFYLPDSNPFEEWAAARREAYRRIALNALESLTNVSLEVADYQAAER